MVSYTTRLFLLILISQNLLSNICCLCLLNSATCSSISIEFTHLCNYASSQFSDLPNVLTTTSTLILSKSSSPEKGGIASLLPLSYIKDEFIRGLVSGAVSRASKEILLHPFDTVRARQQIKTNVVSTSANSKVTSSMSQLNTKSESFQTTGIYKDLYAGLLPALIGGIPAGAVFFAVKDSTKSFLKSSFSASTIASSLILSKEEITILSVMVANLFYWLIRSPSEELKTKQQVGQNTTEFTNFKYISSVIKNKGLGGLIPFLYGSYLSNIIYALPADILKFLAYETISTDIFHASLTTKISGVDAALAGSLSGLTAQVITTPLDVARTRIMAKSKTNTSSNTNSKEKEFLKNKEISIENTTTTNPIQVLQAIVSKEGPSALFKGIIPRAFRAIASGAIQFASYELTQNAMK